MNRRVEQPSSGAILAARGPKNVVDPRRPYAYLVEPERTAAGTLAQVATLFLTNRECPFRCLMCDLWQNTTDVRVPPGAIPEQIAWALAQLPPAEHLKLYNSGNFFDPQAIPPEDYAAIAALARGFENVIVENHPRFCSESCVRFRDLLATSLEIAIGLETVHPAVLPALNKQMTLADFDRAVHFLTTRSIAVRAFVLLRPPYLSEAEGIDWALRSIEHAFAQGVGCCSVIPTRSGNGIMEQLQTRGDFAPPSLRSLELILAAGIELRRGRVFVDLWEAEQFSACPHCGPARVARLARMNLNQVSEPGIPCPCGT